MLITVGLSARKDENDHALSLSDLIADDNRKSPQLGSIVD
jgi:hypothetical protein